MKLPLHVSVINHTVNKPSRQSELLAAWLESYGLHVTVIQLADISIGRHNELLHQGELFPYADHIIWRVEEGFSAATEHLLTELDNKYHLLNPLSVTWLTSNKLLTYDTLIQHGIPAVRTLPAFPGNKLSLFEIAKPQYGSGGRGIYVGDRIPSSVTEAYIKQERYGLWDNFLHVLIAGNQVITSYRQQENRHGASVYSQLDGREQLMFTRDYPELEQLALAASDAVGAKLAEVDVCISQKEVLEINSVPYLPSVPTMMEQVSEQIFHLITESN